MEEKLKEIEELIEKGDYNGAIVLCNSLIEANNSIPIVHLSKAISNYYLDNIEDAIEDINKEIKIFPKCPQLRYIYDNMKLKHNLFIGNYTDVILNFIGTIFYSPKRKTSYVFNSTDYQRIIEKYTKYIEQTRDEFYILQSIKKVHSKDYNGALNDFTKAIEVGGKISSIYEHIYNDINNNKEKIEDYTKLVDENPNNPFAYLYRAEVKSLQQDFEGAIEDLTHAIEIEPNSSMYFQRASCKEPLRDNQDAIEDLTHAIELDPENYNLYYTRGMNKSMVGDKKGAFEDFTKTIELNPKHSDSYNHRANLKYGFGDYEGAYEDCNKAIEICPGIFPYYDLRGAIKLNILQDYKGAIKDYTKVIKMCPFVYLPYYNRGLAKSKLKNYKGAIKDLNKAIEIYQCADFYFHRGCFKTDIKDYKGAKCDFETVINLYYPNFADSSYHNLGFIELELKKYHSAIKYFNKAIELNPDLATSWNNRGYAKYKLKNFDGAFEDCNKAIELDPNCTGCYDSRGDLKQELKDYKGAIEDFNKALELDPKYKGIKIKRAVCYFKMKQFLKGIKSIFEK